MCCCLFLCFSLSFLPASSSSTTRAHTPLLLLPHTLTHTLLFEPLCLTRLCVCACACACACVRVRVRVCVCVCARKFVCGPFGFLFYFFLQWRRHCFPLPPVIWPPSYLGFFSSPVHFLRLLGATPLVLALPSIALHWIGLFSSFSFFFPVCVFWLLVEVVISPFLSLSLSFFCAFFFRCWTPPYRCIVGAYLALVVILLPRQFHLPRSLRSFSLSSCSEGRPRKKRGRQQQQAIPPHSLS